MADSSPLAGLLDQASHVFWLAQQLGESLKREHGGREFEYHVLEPNAWRRHRAALEEYSNAVQALTDVIQNPPAGFAVLFATGFCTFMRGSSPERSPIARPSQQAATPSGH
jgi:hypothetical protein